MNIEVNVYGNLTDYDFAFPEDADMEPDFVVNVDVGRDYCDINTIVYADGTEMTDAESTYWLAELDDTIRDKAGDNYDDMVHEEYRSRQRRW